MFLWRFPILINSKESITEKRRNKVKYLAWNSIFQDFSLRRGPACQTLSKVLNISSAIDWVATNLLRVLAILSDTTLRRSVIDREDLYPSIYLSTYLSIYLLSIYLSIYLSVSLSICLSICMYFMYIWYIYTKHRVWHTASKREHHSEVWRFVHWNNSYWWRTSLSVVRRRFQRRSLKFVLL